MIYPLGMVKSMADFDRATSAALATTDTLVTLNAENNTVKIARPEGLVTYGYDSEGVLGSMSWLGRTVRYEHDRWGRMAQCEANEGRWDYRYGALTAPFEITERASGEREQRNYDGLGRTQSIDHRDATNAIIFRIEYAMGIDGTRRGATETRGGAATAITPNLHTGALGSIRTVNTRAQGSSASAGRPFGPT